MTIPNSVDGESRPERVDRYDRLVVEIYPSRQAMGQAAARAVATNVRLLLRTQPSVRIIFAAAPSQNEFLAALAREADIDWRRVVAFHLDEYVGLRPDAPQNFGNFLRERLFDLVSPGTVNYFDGGAQDPDSEAKRYSEALAAGGLDIACLGIGENGHLAFNDPHVANFADPRVVKLVDIDDVSRLQQVHDGCFAHLQDVPRRALTVTIPPLMGARAIFGVVPGPAKAVAVRDTLRGPIAPSCPASILRRHKQAVLYLDRDSATLLDHTS